jgi:predicted transcriptional regulator
MVATTTAASTTTVAANERSRGLSQIEIAHELQVSEASISSDIQYSKLH